MPVKRCLVLGTASLRQGLATSIAQLLDVVVRLVTALLKHTIIMIA